MHVVSLEEERLVHVEEPMVAMAQSRAVVANAIDLAIEAMESEEGSQSSLGGSPGPAAAIEGEEALAARRPQLQRHYVLEGVVALVCRSSQRFCRR